MNRALLVALLSLVLAPVAAAALHAGAAKRSIVPPFPTNMGGYFDRTADFEGVDRTIYARALVCKNDEGAVAILVADLIGVSRSMVDDVRAAVARETELLPESILIAATHTHSGPAASSGARRLAYDRTAPFNAFMVETLAATLVDAWNALEPATLGFAYGTLDGITTNRQQRNDTIIDPDVGVLKVQAKDSRRTIATLSNFTGHPVILGSSNLLLSCEYPGVACKIVEDVVGGIAIFTQGACGDVTMKRSGPPFEEVTRLGRVLAGEILVTSEQIVPGTEEALHAHSEILQLAPRELPTPEAARAEIDDAKAAAQAGKAAGLPDYQLQELRREVNAANTTAMVAQVAVEQPELLAAATESTCQVLQIGPLVAVAIPGEIFVEYGLEMKKRVAQDTGRPMILVGYANDYIGYIITPRADQTGGYERAVSRVAPSAGRTFTESAMATVRHIVTPVVPD